MGGQGIGRRAGGERCLSVIARRTLFQVATGTLIGAAAGPSQAASAFRGSQSDGDVSPKDPSFGAAGDFSKDDTLALQHAANYCFGSPPSPHGSAGVTSNRTLRIPRGHYKITSPIRLSKLHGGRISGAGRFVTKITNVAGGPVFATNGCAYSRFEGLWLESSGESATVFDLNWDGTAGGAALQSNTFSDLFFSSGGTGIDIGAGGYMGSENIFINCFWGGQREAGLKTSNFNALQNTIVGGNFQSCRIGVWIEKGSVPLIEGVGFQLSKEWDVRQDNSANDTLALVGCRSESGNFVKVRNGVHTHITACSHLQTQSEGVFLDPDGCPATVEQCVSLQGQVRVNRRARLAVRGCSFGRTDWLSHARLKRNQTIEIEDVQYGGTPNSRGNGPGGRILKQRITRSGVFDYQLEPA